MAEFLTKEEIYALLNIDGEPTLSDLIEDDKIEEVNKKLEELSDEKIAYELSYAIDLNRKKSIAFFLKLDIPNLYSYKYYFSGKQNNISLGVMIAIATKDIEILKESLKDGMVIVTKEDFEIIYSHIRDYPDLFDVEIFDLLFKKGFNKELVDYKFMKEFDNSSPYYQNNILTLLLKYMIREDREEVSDIKFDCNVSQEDLALVKNLQIEQIDEILANREANYIVTLFQSTMIEKRYELAKTIKEHKAFEDYSMYQFWTLQKLIYNGLYDSAKALMDMGTDLNKEEYLLGWNYFEGMFYNSSLALRYINENIYCRVYDDVEDDLIYENSVGYSNRYFKRVFLKPEQIVWMVENGANITVKSCEKAIVSCDIVALETLIENIKDEKLKQQCIEQSLIEATIENNEVIVEYLFSLGVNVDVRSECKFGKGATPLRYAAQKGNIQLVKLYLEKGANIDAMDEDGNTPFLMAVSRGRFEVVKIFLEHGVKIFENPLSKKDMFSYLEEGEDDGYIAEEDCSNVFEMLSKMRYNYK